jgi:voltage-gated potassium channel
MPESHRYLRPTAWLTRVPTLPPAVDSRHCRTPSCQTSPGSGEVCRTRSCCAVRVHNSAGHARDDGQVRGQTRRNILVSVGLLVAATGVYALVPWSRFELGQTTVVVMTFVGGLVGTAALVAWQVHTYRRAAATGAARVRGLLLAVYVAMLFFATAYYLLDVAHPEQIDGLKTRLDALYFTLSILSTVGFGDIHAAGQVARAMVSLQIAFDLLVIGLAVTAAKAAHVPSGQQP